MRMRTWVLGVLVLPTGCGGATDPRDGDPSTPSTACTCSAGYVVFPLPPQGWRSAVPDCECEAADAALLE